MKHFGKNVIYFVLKYFYAFQSNSSKVDEEYNLREDTALKPQQHSLNFINTKSKTVFKNGCKKFVCKLLRHVLLFINIQS